MDPKVVGAFIKELRKEKHITQEKLANDILVDRTTVVKWEGGNSLPTNESLVILAEYFNVTLDEILNGVKYPKEASNEQIEEAKIKSKNKVILSLLNSNRKSKKIRNYFILLTSILAIIFLIYYFFTTYNSIHVYSLYGEGEKYNIRDSLLIVTNEKVYLRIGIIESNSELKTIHANQISLYTTNKKIFEGDPNELLVEYRDNIETLKTINLKKEYNNFYIVINYNNQQDRIRLTVKKDYHNKGILFNKINTKNNNYISENNTKLIPNKEFTYNEKDNTYYLKKNNFEITYLTEEQVISIFEFYDTKQIKYNYEIEKGIIYYKIITKEGYYQKTIESDKDNIYKEFKKQYLDKYFSETV